MSSLQRIVLKTSDNGLQNTGMNSQDSALALRKAADKFGKCAVGACDSNYALAANSVEAQGFVTFSANVTNSDTLTIGKEVLTFSTSNNFPIGQVSCIVNQAGTIANLLSAIGNSAVTCSQFVTASQTGLSQVNLLLSIPGQIGNELALAKSSSALSVTSFSGGSEGTVATYSQGL
jgi:hypothetical protein